VSADLHTGEALEGTRAVVRVQAVFHVADEEKAQAVAARMIDSAHEIANLPECECDVDVNVEMAPPDRSLAPVGPSGAPLHGRAPNP
jgi:hypothetical protein